VSAGRTTLLAALVTAGVLLPAGSAAAHVSTTPNSHNFGGQTAGTTSAPFTFTLIVRCVEDPANPGSGMCQAGPEPFTPNVTVTGNFVIRNNNCTSTMPGNTTIGTSCTFGVAFAPLIAGTHSGIVDVGDAAGFGKAAVSGFGLSPPLAPVTPVATTSQPPTPRKKCKKRRTSPAGAAAKKCRKRRG
jgi:hypothetical protein